MKFENNFEMYCKYEQLQLFDKVILAKFISDWLYYTVQQTKACFPFFVDSMKNFRATI